MANPFHEANRRRWDAGSQLWADHADRRGLWRRCHRDPGLAFHERELKWFADVAGKRVAVLGSGDNQAVFALAGMGASVTSVDISDRQIAVARDRVASLGLEVDFVCADVTDLGSLGDATYDVVYTGGHVAVWVSDLERFHREAARILKPGGLLIVSEYHPVRRVWTQRPDRLELGFNYFDRGPHRFVDGLDVLYGGPGEIEQYEFHWMVADYMSAVILSGCRIVDVAEFGDTAERWEGAPLAGLPEVLLVVARRDG